MTEINENCCRICLKREQMEPPSQFRDLNEASFGEFSPHDVLSQLFGLKLDFHLKEITVLPQKICFFCSAKLAVSLEVWSLALASEDKLKEHFKIPPLEDDEVDVKFDPLEFISVEDPALQENDEEDTKDFDTDESESVNGKKKPGAKRGRPRKRKSKEIAKKLLMNKKEIKTYSTRLRNDDEKNNGKKKDSQGPLPCNLCGKIFSKLSNFTLHKRKFKTKEGAYKCKICKEVFRYPCQQFKHFQKKHATEYRTFQGLVKLTSSKQC